MPPCEEVAQGAGGRGSGRRSRVEPKPEGRREAAQPHLCRSEIRSAPLVHRRSARPGPTRPSAARAVCCRVRAPGARAARRPSEPRGAPVASLRLQAWAAAARSRTSPGGTPGVRAWKPRGGAWRGPGGGSARVARHLPEWVRGTHSHRTVKEFFGPGEERSHRAAFRHGADHSEIFAAEDDGAAPVEYVLVALASCLSGGIHGCPEARHPASIRAGDGRGGDGRVALSRERTCRAQRESTRSPRSPARTGPA